MTKRITSKIPDHPTGLKMHNLNDFISYTLTKEGEDILRQYRAIELSNIKSRFPDVSLTTLWKESDLHEMPLWEFCNIFGPFLQVCRPPVIKDMSFSFSAESKIKGA